MTVRVHIDRLVIDRGALEPGQVSDFRAALAADLAWHFDPSAPLFAPPVPAGPAARLSHQVARAIAKRVSRP